MIPEECRMSWKRFTADQIIELLREIDAKLSQSRNVGKLFRQMAITNLLNVFALNCFRLASPVNSASRITPTAPLRAHKPQNLSCVGIHGGSGQN
jgi:hypothetical protein